MNMNPDVEPDQLGEMLARAGRAEAEVERLTKRAETAERELAEAREAIRYTLELVRVALGEGTAAGWLCPACGTVRPGSQDRFCRCCGKPLPVMDEDEKCPRCGVPLGAYAVCPEGSTVRYCSEVCALGEAGKGSKRE